jgi:branched-chain amino acid transport system substrate-binding protein
MNLIALVLTLLLPIVAAPALAADPGVTDTEIHLGQFASYSGPASFWGIGQRDSAAIYFDEVNASGGVNGRKLRFTTDDDECKPAKVVSVVRRLVGAGVFAIFGGNCSNVVPVGLPAAIQGQVPVVVPSASTDRVTNPFNHYVFRTGVLSDALQPRGLVDIALNVLKAKRVAILNQSDEMGKGGSNFLLENLAKMGVKPVAHEQYNVGDTDFAAQIARLKEASPDVTFLYGLVKEPVIILRQAHELGFKTQWIGSTGTSAPSLMVAAGEGAVGLISTSVTAVLPEGEGGPMPELRRKYEARYGKKPGKPGPEDVLGYHAAIVFVEGLKRAGRDLTREKFVAALESMKGFNTGFLPPQSFSPTDHEGTKQMHFVKIVAPGKREILSHVVTFE